MGIAAPFFKSVTHGVIGTARDLGGILTGYFNGLSMAHIALPVGAAIYITANFHFFTPVHWDI